MKMMFAWFSLALLWFGLPVQAQVDGLDLPAPLYLIAMDGTVQRIGLGAEGISRPLSEGVRVVDMALSADKRHMAYRTTDGQLWLLDTAGGTPLMVDGAAGLPTTQTQGETLVWSPSGDALAYTTTTGARVRFFTAAQTVLDLSEGAYLQVNWSPEGAFLVGEVAPHSWWAYRRTGESLALTSAIISSLGVAWRNTGEIILAPESGGLLAMDLLNSNAQTWLLDEQWMYAQPTVLTDKTILAFGRALKDESTAPGFGRLITLIYGDSRSEYAGLKTLELDGLRWSLGSSLLVNLRGGVLALIVPSSGDGLTLPFSNIAAYAWG